MEEDGEPYEVELVSSGTPFAEVQEDEAVEFRLHPADPYFLVRPETDPPSVILRSIPIILAFLMGAMSSFAVVITLF